MKKVLLYLGLVTLVFSACQSEGRTQQTQVTFKSTQEPLLTSTQVTNIPSPGILVTAPKVYPTVIISPSITPTPLSTLTSSGVSQPIIHTQPGDMYETVISIQLGKDSPIQYSGEGVGEINGPIAIAILPDNTFLIADLVSNRLFQYSEKGQIIKTIELEELGIRIATDMRVKGNEVFLLEPGTGPIPQKYWVRHLSLDGILIDSDEIPQDYPIGKKDLTLENGLTGLAIDCEGTVILEVLWGSNLFLLSDVQQMQDLSKIKEGYHCNDKRYFVTTAGPFDIPKISAGDITYQTNLTYKSGGLRFLDVFPDGSFYLIRDDLINLQVIKVDKSVFYIGADGAVEGVARAPISESYYPVMRDMAIGPTGEVYFLLPRPDSLDIVRLNFFKDIGPLTSEAIPPNLSVVNENP